MPKIWDLHDLARGVRLRADGKYVDGKAHYATRDAITEDYISVVEFVDTPEFRRVALRDMARTFSRSSYLAREEEKEADTASACGDVDRAERCRSTAAQARARAEMMRAAHSAIDAGACGVNVDRDGLPLICALRAGHGGEHNTAAEVTGDSFPVTC